VRTAPAGDGLQNLCKKGQSPAFLEVSVTAGGRSASMIYWNDTTTPGKLVMYAPVTRPQWTSVHMPLGKPWPDGSGFVVWANGANCARNKPTLCAPGSGGDMS
jgi:hypothetical protein